MLSKQMFYPDAEMAAECLISLGRGETAPILDDIASFAEQMGADELVTDHAAFGKMLAQRFGQAVRVDPHCRPIRWFRSGHDRFLQENGMVSSDQAVSDFRRDVALRLARATVSEASRERDGLVKMAIDAVGELDKAINILAMRFREWYSLHHPSLVEVVQDHEKLARVVQLCGGRSSMTESTLRSAGLTDSEITRTLEELGWDMGAQFDESDLEIIGVLAREILTLYQTRHSMEEYIEHLMRTVAPNITALVGHMVGARLISLAGSLKDLARKPSSTIQVYGAERSLFRSLRPGAAPPKHGVIFQVPEIHSAPYWRRGKIARALAGKLAIASRIDAYSERDLGELLRAQFRHRVEEIERKSPDEPPPRPKTPRSPKKARPGRRRPRRKKRGAR